MSDGKCPLTKSSEGASHSSSSGGTNTPSSSGGTNGIRITLDDTWKTEMREKFVGLVDEDLLHALMKPCSSAKKECLPCLEKMHCITNGECDSVHDCSCDKLPLICTSPECFGSRSDSSNQTSKLSE